MSENISYKLLEMQDRILFTQNENERFKTEALAIGDGGGHDSSMEARVAVLEEIARSTEKLLEKMDTRMEKIEDRQHSDFKWLLATGIGATAVLLGTMAHGFHWL